MFEHMNKVMDELYQGTQRYYKTETMLNLLKEQLSDLEYRMIQYKANLDKEEADVEKYNKKTITAAFYTILGNKEEQLNKERQEVLAAKLKLGDVEKQIEDTKYNISKLETERRQLAGCERNYKDLYQQKYQMLKEYQSVDAKKIIDLEEKIAFCKSNLVEIEEAIMAGSRVMDRISSALSSLNSAEGWGLWDMWGGGGLVTNMIKHSHIDDAKDAATEIQSLLNSFRSELADIQINSDINIEIDGFVKFADFFFDGLIADWVVQSKINDSQESVKNVEKEVEVVLGKLSQMKTTINNKILEYNNELAEHIKSV